MNNIPDPATGLVDVPDGALDRFRDRGYADEVLPLSPAQRSWGIKNYINVWAGPIHNVLSYFTVVGFFAMGLGAWQVVAAIMCAAVIVSIGYVLNGRAAARYGVPFAMLLRDVFGTKGAIFPALVRGLIAGFVFFGLTTVSSAQALDVAMARLWPGYGRIGGGADFIGLPIPTLVSYLIMWVVTVALYLGGQAFIGRFSNWASPAVYVLAVIGVVLALRNAGGLSAAFTFDPVSTPVTPIAFITCVAMLVSNWAGPIVNISDYSRNTTAMRNPAIGYPVGMLLSYVLFAMVTIAFMASLGAVSGGKIDINNPAIFVEAINSIGNPVVVILLILAFNVGATAFVVFGNMLPSGLQLTAQLPKVFTVKTGGLVAAVVGTLIVPWKFVESTDMLFLFYSFIGSMFGPMVGIMLAWFYVERRGQLNLDDIYTEPGSDGHFPGGVNWRAIGILVTSFVLTMAGKFIHGVGALTTLNNFAFFSGLAIGFIGYLILGGRRTSTTN